MKISAGQEEAVDMGKRDTGIRVCVWMSECVWSFVGDLFACVGEHPQLCNSSWFCKETFESDIFG